MMLARHPLWLVGFRPLFALAMLAGAMFPLAWVLMFSGAVPPAPTFPVPAQQWHAHEMFYGFGWAVLGGFLLTASKNWVGIRGYHGATLIVLAFLWLADRAAMLWGGAWPVALFRLASMAYVSCAVTLLLATLIRHRVSDSFRDNIYFILALPLFLPAKWLLLAADPAVGQAMTLALFRLAFLLMLERTVTQFMKSAFQASLPRIAALDHGIKATALLLVADPWLPPPLGQFAGALLCLLLAARWLAWQPQRAMRRLDIGIMYLGYLAIVAQIALDLLGRAFTIAWTGSAALHVFTVGAMGLIVPAMMVRISKGHTGRKVVFDRLDRSVLWFMLAGLACRVLAPQLTPAAYVAWMHAAAFCWLLGFGILAWRYLPWLMQPRADGREH